MDEMQLLSLTIVKARELIRSGEITPEELVDACLARIARLNGKLNAFLDVMRDAAMQDARYATEGLKRGENWGPLHGIPIAVKDLIDIEGQHTTAGSEYFRYNEAKADADVTRRLRAAGAILIGKTNLHEFAMGTTNINPHYGPARNPWNPECIPGGSSGGSGAAVGALMVPGALGTDTGGSVRIPAALCGITGLRPGKKRVSGEGVVPLSVTLDIVGPMAHTAEDVAVMLDVLDANPIDPASATSKIKEPIKGMRIGVPTDSFFWLESDFEVVGAVRAAIDKLADIGMRVEEIALPDIKTALKASTIIAISEAANYHKERLEDNPSKFGEDVRSRLALAERYTGIEYAWARQYGREWRAMLNEMLHERINVIALPVTPCPAMKIEGLDSIAAGGLLLKFNYPFSLSSLPALSMPCGFTQDGLPIGIQLVGLRESTILRVAHAYQQATTWHTRLPEL
jgi:aspartyl-tRNA(Asn)/glutamyl-tRNA(Gln) amidotransferase subunit A